MIPATPVDAPDRAKVPPKIEAVTRTTRLKKVHRRSHMGLQEKRMLKQVQEEQIPATKKAIQEASNADISVEIDQPSFMDDQYAKSALEYVQRSGFDVVV